MISASSSTTYLTRRPVSCLSLLCTSALAFGDRQDLSHHKQPSCVYISRLSSQCEYLVLHHVYTVLCSSTHRVYARGDAWSDQGHRCYSFPFRVWPQVVFSYGLAVQHLIRLLSPCLTQNMGRLVHVVRLVRTRRLRTLVDIEVAYRTQYCTQLLH